MTRQSRLRVDGGAVLIHVAFALLALIGFTAFVVDMGVMWVSRGQAQNAADAGALAGAVALMRDGGWSAEAQKSALQWAGANAVFGLQNSAANVRVTFSGPTGTCGASCDVASIPPCGEQPGCVRADVFRNMPDRDYRGGATLGAPVATLFGPMVGVTQQGVRATATAEVAPANLAQCMLPFAVIDRWADNYDPTPVTTHFPDDGLIGAAGWTPNDAYEPAAEPADVYIPPYAGNTGHTGWRLTNDYGRQLVLRDGSAGSYPSGWSQLVCLNGAAACSGTEVRDWLTACNPQQVGIAPAVNPCTAADAPHGCIEVRTGLAEAPVTEGVENIVALDPAAAWSSGAHGPLGPGTGAVTGGQGMTTPRIRGMVVLDIGHYASSGCAGGTCVAKVANIIGFFVEGICNTVTLDAGLVCDDPTSDVVGRIVTLPAQHAAGTGEVVSNASFIHVVRLVR
jgi:hypothetical protein